MRISQLIEGCISLTLTLQHQSKCEEMLLLQIGSVIEVAVTENMTVTGILIYTYVPISYVDEIVKT